METRRNSTTYTVGFSLLPSELIQYIILQLTLPYIFQLKSVSKSISDIISDQSFIREYNLRSSSATWLFIYKKRWQNDAVLHGFTDTSYRWFKVLIGDLLKPVVPPGEDLYFLTAAGNFFLFALNNSREVISVNPIAKTVKKIPQSPLGPRGTSSWRRSGMKLLSGPTESGHFRFLFVELLENNPILFEYDSKTNKWTTIKAREDVNLSSGSRRENDFIFLSASNGPSGSVVIAVGSNYNTPVIIRPRFNVGWNGEGELAIGFSWGNMIDRLHVYGNSKMFIVQSGTDYANQRIRILKGAELWGLSSNGRQWDFISSVPGDLIDQIKKPYGVMMGCLEERQGTIRVVLMSNFEGVWDIIWLCYDVENTKWKWVPVPDCKMKGSNMAGITFSSGLTISCD